MSETWRRNDLPDVAATLATRPGHEAVRTQVMELLRHGFGVAFHEVTHELRLPEVHGRADALFGATVFEFKADLRRELADVLSRLPDYLRDREMHLKRPFLGIATDGATFIAYELRDGAMREIGRHETRADRPGELLAWLEPSSITPGTSSTSLVRDLLSRTVLRALSQLPRSHLCHPRQPRRFHVQGRAGRLLLRSFRR